jgi:hypothetical protein
MKTSISKKWLIIRHGVEKYLFKNFGIFSTNSAGDPNILGFHTEKSINLTFPSISKLLINLRQNLEIINAKVFCIKKKKIREAKNIKNIFKLYGSDKAKLNYHFVYASLFKNPKKVKKIFEVGIGTNNENIISNMGPFGKPGASLRAFRDYFKNSTIYGADIDRKILFKESRIKTFYVDQTNENSLKKLFNKMKIKFDLIVDDGLHSPYANLNMINVSLKYLKKNGWLLIEDIPFRSKSIWEIVQFILEKKYFTKLIKGNNCFIFVIKRIK